MHPGGQGQITSSDLYFSANRMVKLLLKPHSVSAGFVGTVIWLVDAKPRISVLPAAQAAPRHQSSLSAGKASAPTEALFQLVDLREKLQETMGFPMKYGIFP